MVYDKYKPFFELDDNIGTLCGELSSIEKSGLGPA